MTEKSEPACRSRPQEGRVDRVTLTVAVALLVLGSLLASLVLEGSGGDPANSGGSVGSVDRALSTIVREGSAVEAHDPDRRPAVVSTNSELRLSWVDLDSGELIDSENLLVEPGPAESPMVWSERYSPQTPSVEVDGEVVWLGLRRAATIAVDWPQWVDLEVMRLPEVELHYLHPPVGENESMTSAVDDERSALVEVALAGLPRSRCSRAVLRSTEPVIVDGRLNQIELPPGRFRVALRPEAAAIGWSRSIEVEVSGRVMLRNPLKE